jgi:glycosyltransferase involved in cell wall biosynthesis
MKVFYEGTALFNNKRVPQAGIAHYVYNIYKNIVDLDKKNTYEVFGLNFFGKTKDFKSNFPKDTKFRLIQYIPGKVWNISNRRLVLPPMETILGAKADVYIYTQFRLYPSIFAKKKFVVIYDIAFEHYPEFIENKNLQYLKRRVPEAAKKSDKIITISEFTKNDLIKKYSVDPSKIIVAHCSVNTENFKRTQLTKRIKKKYNLPNDYLLYLGTIEPRKNIANLLRAYSKLPKNIKDQYPLVLAGGGGWNDDEIKSEIEKAKKDSQIIQTGYVDEKDIPALYSGAELFLYPSHFEGFGMQILEAMACGTPVLTAKNSSLPEVGGNAAYYVDDKSIDSIRNGIEKLLSDPDLRKELVKKGKQQIKKFSWKESAQKIIDAINE